MGSLTELRSRESSQKSPVQFVNRTNRSIEIFWLNFSGQQVSYGTLSEAGRRRSAKAIDTFVSHPWIAVDHENRQRLWFDRKDVFFPPAPNLVRVAAGPNREEVRVKRLNIFITKPVFNADSLMDICCCFISRTLTHEEDIDKLPLPDFMKTGIRRKMQ